MKRPRLWATLTSYIAQKLAPLYLDGLLQGHTSAQFWCQTKWLCLSPLDPNLYEPGQISYGHQLHSYILRSGFVSNVYVSTALLNFYLKFDSLTVAHQLFVEIPHPGVVTWNSLISGCVHCGQFGKALGLFLQLDKSAVFADAFSFTGALVACGQLSLSTLGESVHSKIVKFGVESSLVVANCLIDMYGKCGYVEEAKRVFHSITDKDNISWNSVIAACARNQQLQQAFNFLHQMPDPDTISYNELINGISQFGNNIEDAIQILSKMQNPNSSSWNSIITGCVNRGRAREALDILSKMHSKDIEMDQFTFSSILSGIAGLSSALTWGLLVHCCTIKYGLDSSIVVGSALIDMYSKCGQIKNAESIFETLPEKNLVTWNAMISGFAHNGDSDRVIQLFEQLKSLRDLKPDGITFLNVLSSSACSDKKMTLEIAMHYLESMIEGYGIEPTPEHRCSMIRVMGQSGEVWRAEKMMHELGFGSCGLVWRALLGACGACEDLRVAELAAAKVIVLEGDNEFVYVMLSNIYACYGKWRIAFKIRDLMRAKGVRKEVGCSWIEAETVM